MHIFQTDINHNSNIGIYVYTNDHYCLVGEDLPKEIVKNIEEALKVPVHRVHIAGTTLVGVFCAGNNNILLIPGIVFEREKQALRKLGIKFTVIDTELTALGNNILANDKGAIINPDFRPEEKAEIEKALGVPVIQEMIAGLEIVGSCAVMSDKSGLVHRDADFQTLANLRKMFGIKFFPATVNQGSPYIHSGLVVNKNGLVVGRMSTGVETTEADESLGFLE